MARVWIPRRLCLALTVGLSAALALPTPAHALRPVNAGAEESPAARHIRDELAAVAGGMEEGGAEAQERVETFIEQLAASGGPLTVEQLMDLNALIAGEAFRGYYPTPKKFTFSEQEQLKWVDDGVDHLPGLLRDFVDWVSGPIEARNDVGRYPELDPMIEKLRHETIRWDDPVEFAATAGWVLWRIVNFIEGNHRTVWRVVDLLLRRSGSPPLLFQPGLKDEYYSALGSTGSPRPLIQFFKKTLQPAAGLEAPPAFDTLGGLEESQAIEGAAAGLLQQFADLAEAA